MPPLILILATRLLFRAWAGGRIKERRPITGLAGFCGGAVLDFPGLRGTCLGDRRLDGPPLDLSVYRAALPGARANLAGKLLQEAVALIDERGGAWKDRLAEVARLPTGVIEMPCGDGQAALLQHLPACQKMSSALARRQTSKVPSNSWIKYLPCRATCATRCPRIPTWRASISKATLRRTE